MTDKNLVPVGLSNRHVHLSEADLQTLFGEGYELTELKPLSQPGQYAANEVVDVVGPKRTLSKVRILGPTRPSSQVEVSITDSFYLGAKVPIRNSGDLEGTPGCKLIGPKGEVELSQGLIAAARHIHMHTDDAAALDLKDKDIVRVKIPGDRGMILENVLIRVHETYALDMHIDTDEGNAGLVRNGDLVEIIK